MKATKETYLIAVAFAANDDLDQVTYECEYKGGVVYHATCEAEENACVGYPHFIIVEEGKNSLSCRYSTPDEALEIMRNDK